MLTCFVFWLHGSDDGIQAAFMLLCYVLPVMELLCRSEQTKTSRRLCEGQLTPLHHTFRKIYRGNRPVRHQIIGAGNVESPR